MNAITRGGRGMPARRRAARATSLLATVGAAIALASCGGDEEGSGGSASGEKSTAAATPVELFKDMKPAEGTKDVDTAKFKKDEESYTIGFADWEQINGWRTQARATAEMVSKDLGVELKVTEAPPGDSNKQIADVEDLLAQGIDALVIVPMAPEPLAPVIERAADSGIPVILWTAETTTDKWTAKILTDEFFFGQVGGKSLCDELGGKGDVVMLRGIAGNSVEKLRYDGARSEIDKCGLEVVGEEYADWNEAKGKAATETLLASQPDMDGIWSSGADMTRGAISAFQDEKKELVPMTGEHNNGFLKIWKETGIKSVAPVAPNWEGAEAVKLAVLSLRGEPIKRDYLIRPEPITNETLDQAIKPDLSDDYWVEGYLTDAQVEQIFPSKGK